MSEAISFTGKININNLRSRIGRPIHRTFLYLRSKRFSGLFNKAEINPYRVVWVDPNQITMFNWAFIPKRDLCCRVVGGDWDLNTKPLANMRIYKAFIQHFHIGLSWTGTEQFKRSVSKLEDTIILHFICLKSLNVALTS